MSDGAPITVGLLPLLGFFKWLRGQIFCLSGLVDFFV